MTTFAPLKSGATSTTNPAPTVNPLKVGDKFILNGASLAWTALNSKALFLTPGKPQGQRLYLVFVPSTPSATYTVTAWRWVAAVGQWIQYFVNGSNNYTGLVIDYFDNFDDSPLFFQLSNISSGTVSIYYDSDLASAA